MQFLLIEDVGKATFEVDFDRYPCFKYTLLLALVEDEALYSYLTFYCDVCDNRALCNR
jgi:hypothetical protein